jgi:hypothetical protein
MALCSATSGASEEGRPPPVGARVGVWRGGLAVIELPGRQRDGVGERGEYPVPEVRGDSPGALQDGDVVDQASGRVGQDCYSGDLALGQGSLPEQDQPFVVAYLIGVFEIVDDAGSPSEVPQREFLAVQVRGQGRGVVRHVLGEQGGHRGAIAPFSRFGETVRNHGELLPELTNERF